MLLSFAAEMPRSTILAFPERLLADAVSSRYRDLIERRSGGEPVAYILGYREFYSIRLELNHNVLIPRPESELLVDAVLSRTARDQKLSVLDLGAGSGALALAIKYERPNALVTAVDASSAALRTAAANGHRLGCKVRWVESDWFAALGRTRFNFVVCNPPYVRSHDDHMQALCHEPRLALDGGADGLASIRRVLASVRGHLAVGGLLAIEHGFDQAAAVAAIAEDSGLEVLSAEKDLAGHVRMAVIVARE